MIYHSIYIYFLRFQSPWRLDDDEVNGLIYRLNICASVSLLSSSSGFVFFIITNDLYI
jgi:hypothetical protein